MAHTPIPLRTSAILVADTQNCLEKRGFSHENLEMAYFQFLFDFYIFYNPTFHHVFLRFENGSLCQSIIFLLRADTLIFLSFE